MKIDTLKFDKKYTYEIARTSKILQSKNINHTIKQNKITFQFLELIFIDTQFYSKFVYKSGTKVDNYTYLRSHSRLLLNARIKLLVGFEGDFTFIALLLNIYPLK